MSICQLPTESCQRLLSSWTLSTPTALVKELIDNALDAKATCVEVVISPNVIDKVEVRDNGEGILPADFDALGRRGYTSKLKRFQDLPIVGGSTLGFRGVALASARAVAEVVITTKTSNDAVATRIYLHEQGGVSKQENTSAPAGTTVTATRLFSKWPVRQKVLGKAASRTGPEIRELLETYALARPAIRFSLKLLKTSKLAWVYAPQKNCGAREAVLQLFGAALASQCVQRTYSCHDRAGCEYRLDESASSNGIISSSFAFTAFMPMRSCDVSKIEGKGGFMCVDHRPLSSSRGIGKDLMTVFRSALRQCFSRDVRNPFIWLNIQCPIASYDPNIDPSKSEVLFAEEKRLICLFESFCEEVYFNCTPNDDARVEDELLTSYGHAPVTEYAREWRFYPSLHTRSPPDTTSRVGPKKERLGQDINLWLYGSGNSEPDAHVRRYASTGPPLRGQQAATSGWKLDMSASLEISSGSDDADGGTECHGHEFSQLSQDLLPAEPPPNSLAGINPWVIAKMAGPVQPKFGRKTAQLGSARMTTVGSMHGSDLSDEMPVLRPPVGPVPEGLTVSLRPRAVSREVVNGSSRNTADGKHSSPPISHSSKSMGAASRRAPSSYAARLSQTGLWTPPPSFRAAASRQGRNEENVGQLVCLNRGPNSLAKGNLPLDKKHRKEKPFFSNGDNSRAAWAYQPPGLAISPGDGMEQSDRSPSMHRMSLRRPLRADVFNRPGQVARTSPRPIHDLTDNLPTPERTRLLELGQSTREGPRMDRNLVLVKSMKPAVPTDTTRDPVATALPLEAIPPNQETYSICQNVAISLYCLLSGMAQAVDVDQYVRSGLMEEGLDMTIGSDGVLELEKRVKALVASAFGADKQTIEFEINLGSLMKGKGVAKGDQHGLASGV